MKNQFSLDNSKYVYKCRTNNTVNNIFNQEKKVGHHFLNTKRKCWEYLLLEKSEYI